MKTRPHQHPHRPDGGLDATPAFWFAMFAASAFGTNLGDFWVDFVSLGRAASFASLAVISGLAIRGDRRMARRSEGGYWIAIVALRAAATNVGDLLTHDFGFGYVAVSVVLALATLVAGWFTLAGAGLRGTPAVDVRYWIAMFIAGVFGTVAGDLASHTVGLYAAGGLLCILLVAAISLRNRLAPASVMAYWAVILAERSAGTPAGDALASGKAAGLGLPLATLCTGGLLLAALAARRQMTAHSQSGAARYGNPAGA
nr:hypothetical protein [uncultured Rhodopila sp.]